MYNSKFLLFGRSLESQNHSQMLLFSFSDLITKRRNSHSILDPCHIPYLTSKPFKSNSDVFGLTSDLCSDVTSTLLLLTPFVAMQLPLLFLSISTSPICPLFPYCLHTSLHSDLHSYLQHPRIIILIIYPLVTCSDHLRITPSCPHI